LKNVSDRIIRQGENYPPISNNLFVSKQSIAVVPPPLLWQTLPPLWRQTEGSRVFWRAFYPSFAASTHGRGRPEHRGHAGVDPLLARRPPLRAARKNRGLNFFLFPHSTSSRQSERARRKSSIHPAPAPSWPPFITPPAWATRRTWRPRRTPPPHTEDGVTRSVNQACTSTATPEETFPFTLPTTFSPTNLFLSLM